MCRGLNVSLSEGLFDKIDSTRLVLGFYAEPDMDAEGRAEDILGAITFSTKSLMFTNGMVFDENAKQIFPPLEKASKPAENPLPPDLN
jgi:hypothetical protein